jgi:hypothetical protein
MEVSTTRKVNSWPSRFPFFRAPPIVVAYREIRHVAATSAALPGSTKAPLHRATTHVDDRHHVMTHGTFSLQWWHVHQDSFHRFPYTTPFTRRLLQPREGTGIDRLVEEILKGWWRQQRAGFHESKNIRITRGKVD